jgi:aspartate 1-decarboxylase
VVDIAAFSKLKDNCPLFNKFILFTMHITMLKAKLHRATVTRSELGYEGSCAIDGSILDLSGIREYEQIQIYNINNGARFTTYAIRAENGSGIFSVNGAAARLACPGDLIIVCAYASLDQQEADQHKPVLIYFNDKNEVLRSASSIPVQMAD